METIYLCIIIFLFVLAVFDLIVGVSNDAVNFLNSAVGAKAASFKTILFIAGIGIFIGASLSNGMMDIARHGIYQPEHFYFAEIMCILLAVMLTDVVLLDVFNSMGMPTSTTVSLVFELLGGTFALSLIKVNNDATLALGDLINTDKALSVIMAIFVSVAIAVFASSGDLLRPDGFVCPGALALFACLALESKGLAALIMCLEIRICRCG